MTNAEHIEEAKRNIVAALSTATYGALSNGALMLACNLRHDEYTQGNHGLPHTRVLDRALQALRKAGKVRHPVGEVRGWELAT